MNCLRSSLAAALACLLCGRAQATMLDAPPPPLRLVVSGYGALQGDPEGLGIGGKLSLRQRLFASDELALRDNFISLGVTGALSPTNARFGLVAEVQPLTILALYASAEGSAYFGNFDNLQSFPSARSDWSTQTLDNLAALPDGDPRRNYTSTASTFTWGARLSAQVGPIAASNESEISRVAADLRAGDRVFYEPTLAALLPQRGFLFKDELTVVWMGGGPLVAGLRWSVLHPYFGARHYAPGEPQQSDNSQMRLGPLVAWQFWKEDGRAFNAPTVFAMVNWWLQHPYRTGAEVSQALPYVVVGFGFFGDLLGLEKR